MVAYGRADGTQDVALWHEMQRECSMWFQRSLGTDSDVAFMLWLHARASTWLRTPRVVVFMIPHAIDRLEAHVAIMARTMSEVDADLRELLSMLRRLGYRQIVVPVTTNAGRSIRRTLRSLGFSNEGTMRAATLGFDVRIGLPACLDTEVWSILLEGDHHGL
jgi:hypothetical protein